MGGGGNSTWIKYLEEKKNDPGLSTTIVRYIPNNIWVAARIKALSKDMKINTVLSKLIEKWAKDEIEI